MARVLALGEALTDVVVRADGTVSEHPGGSVANVAVAFARLGGEVELATWIGADPGGAELVAWLAAAGVGIVVGSTSAAITPRATAHLDRTGAATYEFELDWQVPPGFAVAPGVAAVHTGSIAAWLAPGADDVLAAVRAASSTATVSVDPNVRPSLIDDVAAVRARVDALVATADIVKASCDDLELLAPGAAPDAVAREWLTAGARLVVITCGADGALAFGRRATAGYSPVTPIEVVDTVGAGDTFMGALLWGLAERGLLGAAARPALEGLGRAELADLLAVAATAAEISVGRPGADPPTGAELSATLAG